MPTTHYFQARQALVQAIVNQDVRDLLSDSAEEGTRLAKMLTHGASGIASFSDRSLVQAVNDRNLIEAQPHLQACVEDLLAEQAVEIDYCFLRYERSRVVNAASLKLRVLNGEDVDADFDRFMSAITLWVATDPNARAAWNASDNDLNVGDLLTENIDAEGFKRCMQAYGIEIVTLSSIETDEVRSYDKVLVDEDLLSRWTDDDKGMVEAKLALRGLRLEPSLDGLDEVGDPILDLVTGEMIEEPDQEAIALAEKWMRLDCNPE